MSTERMGTELIIDGNVERDRTPKIQYGALPYRFTAEGRLEILLITTRRTKRWVIPKGWPIKGLKPEKSAAREAYEEAGVRGSVGSQPIGSFTYEKALHVDTDWTPCQVQVFPLLVKRQSITWPEAATRDTRWFDVADAIELIEEPSLRALINSFGEAASSSA